MSLKDRLKSRKEAKIAAERGEYRLSIAKISEAVNKVKNPSDLGNIVKEFAKFLNTLDAQNAQITFSGDFDLGQKMLLNCILAKFLDDGSDVKKVKKCSDSLHSDDSDEKNEAKLMRRRKTVKERLAEQKESVDE